MVMEADTTWVASTDELDAAVQACGRVVALDTEFQRTNTFFPIAGLYQLASAGQIWLIDPLAIDDFSSLVDLLEDPATVTVMHACNEDLELLRHHIGAVPRSLFDTQFAFAFLSDRFAISYTDLVERLTGDRLPSSQTRSNWLRRPLSSGQLRYAAADVRHLEPIYDWLVEMLTAQDRMAWFDEDMQVHGRYLPPDPDSYYKQVGRAWMLEEDELARLQALCAWREHTAMQHDVPRRRVVWDEHLVDLARKSSLDETVISTVVPDPVARRYARGLMDAHDQADAPVEPVQKPLTPGEGKLVKRLRETGVAVAEELGVAQELLARKRDLEALFRHYAANSELDARHRGWRHGVVGEAYGAFLSERLSEKT